MISGYFQGLKLFGTDTSQANVKKTSITKHILPDGSVEFEVTTQKHQNVNKFSTVKDDVWDEMEVANKKKNTLQKVSYEHEVFARNLKNPGKGYDACISWINENAKKNSVTKHYFDDGRVEVEVTEEKGEF